MSSFEPLAALEAATEFLLAEEEAGGDAGFDVPQPPADVADPEAGGPAPSPLPPPAIPTPPEPIRRAAVVLLRSPPEVIDLTLFAWVSSPDTSDEVVLPFAKYLCAFRANQATRRLWVALITALRCARRYMLLNEIAVQCVPLLLPQWLVEDTEEVAVSLTQQLVLGSQQCPSVFHDVVPALCDALDRCLSTSQELLRRFLALKESGAGADAVSQSKAAIRAYENRRCLPVVLFGYYGVRLFPGYDDIYRPLRSRLQGFDSPTDADVLAVLRKAAWTSPVGMASPQIPEVDPDTNAGSFITYDKKLRRGGFAADGDGTSSGSNSSDDSDSDSDSDGGSGSGSDSNSDDKEDSKAASNPLSLVTGGTEVSPFVGLFPWPEGQFSSRTDDLTLVVGQKLQGSLVSGYVGSEENSYSTLLATACEPSTTENLLHVTGGGPRVPVSCVPGGSGYSSTAYPAAWLLPPDELSQDSAKLREVGFKDPAYLNSLAAMWEGYELQDPSSYPAAPGTQVLMRNSTYNRWSCGKIQAVRVGGALCKSLEDDKTYFKPWEDLYENYNATPSPEDADFLRLPSSSSGAPTADSGAVAGGGDAALAGAAASASAAAAAAASGVDSPDGDGKTSAEDDDSNCTSSAIDCFSWIRNPLSPGSRVLGPQQEGGAFFPGIVTQINSDKTKARVKFDDGSEKWAPISAIRVVRPMIRRGGRPVAPYELYDAIATPFNETSDDWVLSGSLKHDSSRNPMPFRLMILGNGERFLGSSTHGVHEQRWIGFRSQTAEEFNLRAALEVSRLHTSPSLVFNPVEDADEMRAVHAAVLLEAKENGEDLDESSSEAPVNTEGLGVGGGSTLHFGGFYHFTLEAWIRPEAREGDSDDQIIFSKANRGQQGEFEFGLNGDGHLFATRFPAVKFTVTDTIFAGEEFLLMFQMMGRGASATPGKDDWIGIFEVGSSNRSAKDQWVKASRSGGMIEWPGRKSPKKAGVYEFRYFRGNGYSCVLAVSDPVTVVEIDADDDDADEGASTPGPVEPSAPLTVTSDMKVPTDTWTHVAVTFNGTYMTLYINAEETSSIEIWLPAPSLLCGSIIGCTLKEGLTTLGFSGRIAEVRAWSSARSASALRQTMHTRLRGWEPSLLASWPLFDCDALAADLGPYSLHGIPQGRSLRMRDSLSRLWSGPSGSGLLEEDDVPDPLPPVFGGFHSSLRAEDADSAAISPLRFAGSAKLNGLAVSLWQSQSPKPLGATEQRQGGSAWVSSKFTVVNGFDSTAEVTHLCPGAQLSFVLRASSHWGLSPLDGEPIPVREIDTTGGLSAAALDQPLYCVIPPRTLTVQVARLQIDRGVFDLRVYARGPRGPAVCLGETRGSGPEPCRLRVSLKDSYLRVSLTDFFTSRVETPVLCIPIDLQTIFGVDTRDVYIGFLGGPDTIGATRFKAQERLIAMSAKPPLPVSHGDDAVASTSAKQFACSLCTKSFATAVNLGRHMSRSHADEKTATATEGAPSTPANPDSTVSGSVTVLTFKFQSRAPQFPSSSLQDIVPARGNLRALAHRLCELEAAVAASSFSAPWAAKSEVWRHELNGVQSLPHLAHMLLTLESYVLSASFKKSWRTATAPDWRSTLASVKRAGSLPSSAEDESERFASDVTCGGFASMTECLLQLEDQLQKSAFLAYWNEGLSFRWRSGLKNLGRSASLSVRRRSAKDLASMMAVEPALAEVALKSSGDRKTEAFRWLSSRSSVVFDSDESERAQCDASSGSEPDLPACPLAGRYTSTLGAATFWLRRNWTGRTVEGSFSPREQGKILGHVFRNGAGQWILRGLFSKRSYRQRGLVVLKFSPDCSKYTGKAMYGEIRKPWMGSRDTSMWDLYDVGYAGLRNLGNTCYQNSLLQSLFMTEGFRAELLSCQPSPARKGSALSDMVTTTQALRRLYGHLLGSKRPFVVPDFFHSTLPREPWGDKKQQDSYQFMLYLWDALEQSLRPPQGASAPNGRSTDLHKSLFGGQLSNATVCQSCGHSSEREDLFTELQLNFPTNFTPIVQVALVSGKSSELAPPEGFDRIHVNLNAGRSGADFVYLCIKRANSWGDASGVAPVTDIRVLSDSPPAKPPAGKPAPPVPPPRVPAGFELVPGEVNKGGVKRVFLAVRRVPHGSPITAVDVITAGSLPAAAPLGFTKIDEDLNMESDGDYVFLCIKKGGAIRDIRLVGQSQSTKHVPSGYSSIPVDISMCVGYDTHPQSLRLAFTAGGSRPPITALQVVETDALHSLLTAAEAAASEADGNEDVKRAAQQGVVKPALAEAFGWELVGELPGGRFLVCKRGQGSPVTTIEAFRAPVAVPRFGYTAVVDMLPGDSHSRVLAGLGVPPPPPPSGSSSMSVLDNAFASLMGCWRMKDGYMRSITFGPPTKPDLELFTVRDQAAALSGDGPNPGDVPRAPPLPPSDRNLRVYGYLVYAMLGIQSPDFADSDDSGGEESKGDTTGQSGGVFKTGSVRGIAYRLADPSEDPSEDGSTNWYFDGEWNAVGEEDTFPSRFAISVPPSLGDGDMQSSFTAALAGSTRDEHWRGTRLSDASLCPSVLRDKTITHITFMKSSSNVPRGFSRIARTTTGESAAITAYSDPFRSTVQEDGSEKMVDMFVCVARTRDCAAASGVALVPAAKDDDEAKAMKADSSKSWVRVRHCFPTIETAARLHSAEAEKAGDEAGGGGGEEAPRAPGMSLWYGSSAFLPGERPSGEDTVDSSLPFSVDESAPDGCVAFNRPGQVLLDLCLVLDGQRIPEGYEDSGIKLPSSACGGRALRLCLHYSGTSGSGTLPFEGVWLANDNQVEMVAHGTFEGYLCHSSYVEVGDTPSDMSCTPGTVLGVFYPRPAAPTCWDMDGFWVDPNTEFRPGYPMQVLLSSDFTKVNGNWSEGSSSGDWSAVKDTYLSLGYSVDSSTLWCLGSPVFSPSVPDHSLMSLLRRFHVPEIVEYTCDACSAKSTAIKRMDIGTFPEHLLLVAKRFEMDWTTDTAVKLMTSVPFPESFVYPCDARRTAASGTDTGERSLEAPAKYGLYAVLVHSGSSLNRGHYYTFARSSACPSLTRKDSRTHPWMRFDDADVTRTSFKSFTSFLASSDIASAYMLFYRRVHDDEDGRLKDGAGAGAGGATGEPASEPGVGACVIPTLSPNVERPVLEDNHSMLDDFEAQTGPNFLEEMHDSYVRRLSKIQSDEEEPGTPLDCPMAFDSGSVPSLDQGYLQYGPTCCPDCSRTWSRKTFYAAGCVCKDEPGEGTAGAGPGAGAGAGASAGPDSDGDDDEIPVSDVLGDDDFTSSNDAPSHPTTLERQESTFVCSNCAMIVVGIGAFAEHLDSCG